MPPPAKVQAGTAETLVTPPRVLPSDSNGRSVWPANYLHDGVVALGNERGIVCSGTLIAATAVLTAAHCRHATWALVVQADGRRQRIGVRGFAVPPNRAVDAAVATLSSPAPVTPYRLRNAADDLAPDESVRIVGFGSTDARGNGAGTRRWADVATDGWGCSERDALKAGCTPSLDLLLRSRDGADTCFGDSGGPVLELREGRPRVLAVTSRGVRDATETCGAGGVYVRVDRIRSWLDIQLSNHRK